MQWNWQTVFWNMPTLVLDSFKICHPITEEESSQLGRSGHKCTMIMSIIWVRLAWHRITWFFEFCSSRRCSFWSFWPSRFACNAWRNTVIIGVVLVVDDDHDNYPSSVVDGSVVVVVVENPAINPSPPTTMMMVTMIPWWTKSWVQQIVPPPLLPPNTW